MSEFSFFTKRRKRRADKRKRDTTLPSLSLLSLEEKKVNCTQPDMLECQPKLFLFANEKVYIKYRACMRFLASKKNIQDEVALFQMNRSVKNATMDDKYDLSQITVTAKMLAEEYEETLLWQSLCRNHNPNNFPFSNFETFPKKILKPIFINIYGKLDPELDKEIFLLGSPALTIEMDHVIAIKHLRCTKLLDQFANVELDPCTRMLVMKHFNILKGTKLPVYLQDVEQPDFKSPDFYYVNNINIQWYIYLCKTIFYVYVTYPLIGWKQNTDSKLMRTRNRDSGLTKVKEGILKYSIMLSKDEWVTDLSEVIFKKYGWRNPLVHEQDESNLKQIVKDYERLFAKRFYQEDLTSNTIAFYLNTVHFGH